MNFLTKVIVAFFTLGVLFFAVLLAVIGFTGIQAKDQSMHAVYSYNLDITTSKPLHNATLLIPVPCSYDDQSEEWRTFLNLSEATLQNFDTGNNSMRIESKNGCKYLNVSAKIILPVYKNHIEPIPIYPGQNESELPPTPTTIYSHICSNETPVLVSMELHNYFIKKDSEIDTKHPFEKEQLMRPFTVQNISGKDDGSYNRDFFEGKINDNYSESYIEVPVYLSYEAESDNILTISCSLRGANEWWCLGWSGNSYEQRIENSFTGSRNGTYRLEGSLITGEGVY